MTTSQVVSQPSINLGKPVERFRITLEDGTEYYVYNRGRDGHQWREVSAARADRRVFVERTGHGLFWYDFRSSEDRGHEPERLMRQLQEAIDTAKGYRIP